MAVVAVPEISMNENDRIKLGENEIWLARQFAMNAVTKSKPMKPFPDCNLRSRIL
jgi:hypothetical protein